MAFFHELPNEKKRRKIEKRNASWEEGGRYRTENGETGNKGYKGTRKADDSGRPRQKVYDLDSESFGRKPVERGIKKGTRPDENRRKGEEKSFAPKNGSNGMLYDRIRNGLFVNEAVSDRKFFSARRAEYLERAVYVCPFCGLAAFRSRGNVTDCLTCHRRVRYHTDKHLSGEGYKFPFRYVNDWYEYQNTFVRGLPLSADTEHTIRSGEWFFKDEGVGIFEVIPYKKKKALLGDASVQLHADGISISAEGQTRCIPFRDVDSAAVLGRNKLNVYYQDRIWQFKGKKRFNALKYLNFIYRFKQGESDGEFLGL